MMTPEEAHHEHAIEDARAFHGIRCEQRRLANTPWKEQPSVEDAFERSPC